MLALIKAFMMRTWLNGHSCSNAESPELVPMRRSFESGQGDPMNGDRYEGPISHSVDRALVPEFARPQLPITQLRQL